MSTRPHPAAVVEIAGQSYECWRGSDVDRDGMYLELSKADGDQRAVIAEIFYSDVTAEMTMSLFRENVPLPAIEWMIESAKTSLPPIGNVAKDKQT